MIDLLPLESRLVSVEQFTTGEIREKSTAILLRNAKYSSFVLIETAFMHSSSRAKSI